MLYLAVFVGALFVLLTQMNKALVRDDFKFIIFIRKNLGSTILNMIAGAIIIWAVNLDTGQLATMKFDFTKLFCIFLGVSGQVVFKALMQLMDKTYKTWFGINKK